MTETYMDKEKSLFDKMKMTLKENNRESFTELQHIILPSFLHTIYGSDLYLISPSTKINRPNIYGSLVMSQEGYYAVPSGGSAAISRNNQADAFMLSLLHVPADAVMLGAETLRKESNFRWHYSFVLDYFLPEKYTSKLKNEFTELRKSLNKPLDFTPTIFISHSGSNINLQSSIFHDSKTPTYIATGKKGFEKISEEYSGLTKEIDTNNSRQINLKKDDTLITTVLLFGAEELDIVSLATYLKKECGIQFLLYEGGQRGLNTLVKNHLVDQFFLTHMSFSPDCSTEELKVASYLFTGETHMIPEKTRIIDARKDPRGEATLYNLDFRNVDHL